jgi:hypothetical protein
LHLRSQQIEQSSPKARLSLPHARLRAPAGLRNSAGAFSSCSVAPCRNYPWSQLALLGVLPFEDEVGTGGVGAEVAAVDDEALAAALHLDDRFGERGVGRVVKGGADATSLRVDAEDRLEVDEPM